MPTDKQESQPKPLERRRTDDFSTRYSNNILLESSAWDLKLIFGQLDQNIDPKKDVILQHTALTVPWPQLKLLSYLLQVNVIMHEAQMGRIHMPSGVIIKVEGKCPAEVKQAYGENAEKMWEELRALYDAFTTENPEVVP